MSLGNAPLSDSVHQSPKRMYGCVSSSHLTLWKDQTNYRDIRKVEMLLFVCHH